MKEIFLILVFIFVYPAMTLAEITHKEIRRVQEPWGFDVTYQFTDSVSKRLFVKTLRYNTKADIEKEEPTRMTRAKQNIQDQLNRKKHQRYFRFCFWQILPEYVQRHPHQKIKENPDGRKNPVGWIECRFFKGSIPP